MKLQVLFLAMIFITSPVIWLVPRQWTGRVMMCATFCIYAWIAPVAVALLIGCACLQWLSWHPVIRNFKWVPVLIPLIPLVIVKTGFTYAHWLVPLGLSYYAFRQIHVAFECYKGTMQRPGLIEYLQYLLFLPVILIGPIHRMPAFQRSLRRHKWDPRFISEGLERILFGLVKISFLGNFLFSVRFREYAEGTTHYFPRLYLEIVAFTGNAYFQFAGFSDLAVGGALLWGVRIIENFNAPFLATNMQMFWQRWHISLSGWCREYVFQPIAGFTRNRWLALIVSMLVLALWHEISLRYIAWGSLQAVLILVTIRLRKLIPKVSLFINENAWGKWLGRIWVFHLFAFSCTLIGSESIESLEPLLKKILKYV